ncbi:MAG: hypothetical protein HYW90_03580 [Candidatus Sungbacteria bacterium]|nr:hypothetical protein [Candidatus Sungbacteria bacterium]
MELIAVNESFRNSRFKVTIPMRSFFSPARGILPGTVIILTGEFLIKISRKFRFNGTAIPSCSMKVGIRWGKNMKGTDWVTETRLKRCAIPTPEPPGTFPPSKAIEEIKRLSFSTPRRRR